jgi:hypothetical protein
VVSVHVLCICSGRERVAGPSCCILSKTWRQRWQALSNTVVEGHVFLGLSA